MVRPLARCGTYLEPRFDPEIDCETLSERAVYAAEDAI